jgi:DNA-binding beta-propeller fold protein YncE
LTTALVVLKEGWVIVGSLPTSTQGTVFTGAGCLIVLDSAGNPVETFYGSLINGPWDMTAFEGNHEARLFVTNVLNGTVEAGGAVVRGGTVTRLNLSLSGAKPALQSITIIGSGFAERTDPAALVIGPTGVGLKADCDDDRDDCPADGDRHHDSGDHDSSVLYVADTLGNRVTVIDRALSRTSSAGTGRTLSSGGSLNAPLGLVVTPGGHVLTVNSSDGFITEISPHGMQVARKQLDNTPVPGSLPGAGTLFGLAFDPAAGVYFVDDGSNTLNLLHH